MLVAVDSGNGVSGALDYRRRFPFINTELTVHLLREPAGGWVCLDAITRPGSSASGSPRPSCATSAGSGHGTQALLVRAR